MNLKAKIRKEWQRFINRVLKSFAPEQEESYPQGQETQNTPPTGQGTGVSQTEDGTEQSKTVKIIPFGSPNCSKAIEDPDTRIKDLKMSSKGLSYKWAKGSLANWGIKDKHDASALAIAGYQDGQSFLCGKFDWISTDRLTRSFENIEDHYNGWDPQAFHKAPHRCFFIMSKDGKKRTNILTD